MGSIVSSVGNFLGDVAGGIGDFAGKVVETAKDYAPEIATVLAAYYTGNPELALDTFGSSTAAEIAAAEAASAAAASGATASGIGSLSNFLPGTTGGGYSGGMISTGIEDLDNALNLAKSGYNLYSLYNQPQTISQQYNQPIQPLTVKQTSSGSEIDPTKFSQGLQYTVLANTPELADITEILMNPIYKVGDALSNIGVSDIAEAIKKYGPTIISVIGGKLSYDDQKRINDIIMGAYNKYNVGTELKKVQYRTGQGLPSLPIYRSNLPIGSQTTTSAPARTAADVVYKPVAKANGGRIGYADGTLVRPLGLLFNPDGSYPTDKNNINLPSMPAQVRNIGLFQNPDGSYPGDNMPNPIQALPQNSSGGLTAITNQQPQILTQAMNLLQNPKTINNLPSIQNVMQKAKQDPQLMATIRKILPIIQSRRGLSTVMRANAAKGGLMNLMNHEMDLRAKGGFVPIGKKERADDVPARLSLNEFVMTAKAVRNAGKGSVNKGAKKMYSLMKRLEEGASL